MIDFAGLVGRFTGKSALDAAQQPGATPASGVAAGGQFAALVDLAARLDAGGKQNGLRLVVDNGPATVPMGNISSVDAAFAPSTVPTPAAVIDPSMSSKIAAWTDGAKDGLPAARTTDAAKKPVSTVQSVAPGVIATLADAGVAIALPDAGLPADKADASAIGTAPDDMTSEDTKSEDTKPDRAAPDVAQIAQPAPPVAQPAVINPAQATTMTVAYPSGEPDTTPPTRPAPPIAWPTGTVPPGSWKTRWSATAAPPVLISDEPLVKYAEQPGRQIVDGPIFSTTAQPGQKAVGETPPKSVQATLAAATAPAGPVVTAQNPAQTAPVIPAALAQQVTPVASIVVGQQVAPAVTAHQAPAPTAAGTGTTQDLPTADQASITLAPLSGAPRMAPARAPSPSPSASADVAGTPQDTVSVTGAAPHTEDAARSTTAKTSDPSPAFASDATTANAPLRAIVEALPPVIQSELSAPSVRGVSGPSMGQALGDQVIDMGVSGQWIDRMAREIAGLADGTGHSRFTLNPPHLGSIQVDLWRDQTSTNVRLMTETDEAAERLNEGRQSLQADARVAALGLGTITVEKAATPFDSSRDQGRDQQRQGAETTQQQANGQAQGRAGQGGNGNQGQASDWVRRAARDDANQSSDASVRAPAERAVNGRVRFA